MQPHDENEHVHVVPSDSVRLEHLELQAQRTMHKIQELEPIIQSHVNKHTYLAAENNMFRQVATEQCRMLRDMTIIVQELANRCVTNGIDVSDLVMFKQ